MSGTLQSLVENEKGEKKRTATEGLMWLLRGLSFTCTALQFSQSDEKEELSASFTKGYEGTLKKHHNFVIKGVFSVRITSRLRCGFLIVAHIKVAMKACPYRKDFYAKLAADPDGGAPASMERLKEALNKWLAALSAIVKQMEAFYEEGGYNKGF